MNKAKIIRIVTIAVIVLILVLLTSVLAFSQHIPAAEQETKELTSEQLEWQKHFKETQMNYLLSLSDNEFETLMENRYGDYTYWSDEYIDELRAKRKELKESGAIIEEDPAIKADKERIKYLETIKLAYQESNSAQVLKIMSEYYGADCNEPVKFTTEYDAEHNKLNYNVVTKRFVDYYYKVCELIVQLDGKADFETVIKPLVMFIEIHDEPYITGEEMVNKHRDVINKVSALIFEKYCEMDEDVNNVAHDFANVVFAKYYTE